MATVRKRKPVYIQGEPFRSERALYKELAGDPAKWPSKVKYDAYLTHLLRKISGAKRKGDVEYPKITMRQLREARDALTAYDRKRKKGQGQEINL